MCIVSAVLAAQAGGRGAGYVCVDGVRLEPGELLAAEAALPFAERAFMGAVRGDAQARSVLWGWLMQRLAARSDEQGWKIRKGEKRGRRFDPLARAVLAMIVDGEHKTAAWVYGEMGISQQAYDRAWSGRLGWLMDEGFGLARRAKAGMSEAVGGA